MTLERKKTRTQEATTMIKEGRRQRKPSQKSPARGGRRGNGLQVTSLSPDRCCHGYSEEIIRLLVTPLKSSSVTLLIPRFEN